jgi:hypothetical protein
MMNNQKKCEYKGCKTVPSYGMEYGKLTHCSTHANRETMLNNGKKCISDGCNITASFGPDKGNIIYCFNRNENRYNNLISTKCVNCNVFQTKKENDHLCQYCNPNSVKRMGTKENKIKKLLEDQGYDFIHNKQFTNECCLKYRPDFLFNCKTYFVVLEVDEDAHSGYDKDCEIIRMNNICSGLGLPTLFIRYNPDKKGIEVIEKYQTLMEILDKNLNNDFLEDPTPIYIYY